ncbi:hypothetical protein GCM10007913_06710 [Devosia yakushimensis]|uniref:Uncharacterized protein n=1 Tax=Devosia yakushimensis TaxID=470028 RepID=A0ABQ5UBX7_9HYPH|nr:hypothetical protein [Devosia yakushimensis]GLQ08739.1 hypothetical protein GCM10007913_06710 [Devosia yakushimensis]
MIPAPYHFENITREACIHPDVEAEIEAARRREGNKHSPTRPHPLAVLIRRLLPEPRVRHDWFGTPAE